MKAPQNWSKATLQEIKKVKSATKEYQESILKAISVSIDENSVSGKNNKDFISKWSGASSDDRIKLLETADKSMKDYLKTVDESGPTWEGFVKYQKNAAAQIEATGVESKLAAVGLNIFKAAAGMLVTVIAQFAIQKLIEGFDYLVHIEEKLAQKSKDAREQYRVQININIKSIKVSENQLLFDKLIIPQSMVMSIYKNSAKYSH